MRVDLHMFGPAEFLYVETSRCLKHIEKGPLTYVNLKKFSCS